MKAIQLPARDCPYASTKQLADDLQNWFAQHPGLPDESIAMLVCFTLATWFPEISGILPALSVFAPDASGADLLVRLLRSVCRRSLCLGEITESGIFDVPFGLHPTLLIEQEKPTDGLLRVLRAMSRPGVLVPRNGHYRDICCPFVICSGHPLGDPGLPNAIQVVLLPARGSLPRIDGPLLTDVANELQGKLLRYRLTNFTKVQGSQFEAPGLRSPVVEIARTLGSCVVDHDELQSRVIKLLKPQNEESQVRNSTRLAAVVVESAVLLCHEKHRESAYVSEFAAFCNTILKNRNEAIELEPRAVGDLLRALGLFSERLGSAGRGLMLFNDVRRKIHSLARAYDVPSLQGGPDRCKFCAELRLEVVPT